MLSNLSFTHAKLSTTPAKISTTPIQISATHQNKYYSWGKRAILCTVYLTIVQLTFQQGHLKEWQSNPHKLGFLDHSFR